MKLATLAIALLALLEVNVFFWRQHGHNLRQEEMNAYWTMIRTRQEEIQRNIQELTLRVEKLEPAGDPMLPGRAGSLGRDKSE